MVMLSKSIAACDVCKKTKDSTSFPTGLLHPLPIPTSILTSWSIYFITALPLSQGYNAIFVCMDRLTKCTKLILCFIGEDLLTDEQVALLLFWNVVHFGVPKSVIHDRDPRLTSDFGKSLLKLYGSCTIAIFAHHHQADSQTECMNCTIGESLLANLLDKDQERWPDYVAVNKMAINSIISTSIWKSILKSSGENTPLSVDLLLSKESSINPHTYKLTIKITKLVEKVKSAMHNACKA